MTEQEQQILKNILLWEHEKAPELAMLLVKGIDLEDRYWKNSLRFAKRVIPRAIKDCQNENNSPIPMYRFLTTAWEGDVKIGGENMKDLALIYILYSLYPYTYQEVETLEVFKPEHADERTRQAISFYSVCISNGIGKLNNCPVAFRENPELLLAELSQRPELFMTLTPELRNDHQFQLAALGRLDVVELIQNYAILEKNKPDYNSPESKDWNSKRNAISADVKRSVNRGYILEHVDEELKDFKFVRSVVRNDGSALKFAGSWQNNEEILLEGILAMVRYSGLHWDFNLWYDDPLEDTLREYLNVLQELGKNGNSSIYEKLLDGLFFDGKDKYSEGFPLRGIEQWKDKYAISWFQNKALGILIYRLVLDCPEGLKIHESLNWDNLCQWFIYATDNVGDAIEGHEGHKHLNMVAPKEFFTSWKYIKWLFDFRWDGVPLFCVCENYVREQIPKDGFNTYDIKDDLQLILKFIRDNPSFSFFFQNGNSKQILKGLSDFINAMEQYAVLINESEKFDDFYFEFSMVLEERIYDIFSENPELKCDKDFILDLLEILNLEKYFTTGVNRKWFNDRYEYLLQYIYDSFSEKDLDIDQDFIQKIISYDPNYWFRINPKILDTEFVFRALNMEISYEEYETSPEEIIIELLEKSDVLRYDKKYILKLADLEATGCFENYNLADLINDTSKDMFNDKAFVLDLIKINPYNISLLNMMEAGASGIYYDDAEDWDWHYSRLSEGLQSDEKFLNELKEIVNESIKRSD